MATIMREFYTLGIIGIIALVFFLLVLIGIVFRWLFRINEIVRHLEHTTAALDYLAQDVHAIMAQTEKNRLDQPLE